MKKLFNTLFGWYRLGKLARDILDANKDGKLESSEVMQLYLDVKQGKKTIKIEEVKATNKE